MAPALASDLAAGGFRPTPVIIAMQLEPEVERLQSAILAWIEGCSEEMHETLRWQFVGDAKYFRSMALFSCFRATHRDEVREDEIRLALIIEIIHNMTLIVDDILDQSEYRRKKLTLYHRFGMLRALMTSGYVVSEAYRIVSDDPYAVRMISELVSRLGVAECLQWRLRSQPLGVEDWRQIAREDTGSMFEVCACLGTRDERLRRFGQLLGQLYHGCDDVADVRGVEGLGGGGEDDLRDGILTLPASIAIRDPRVSAIFCDPDARDRAALAPAFLAALPEAERLLDQIADEARREATRHADRADQLIMLVDYTRGLSQR